MPVFPGCHFGRDLGLHTLLGLTFAGIATGVPSRMLVLPVGPHLSAVAFEFPIPLDSHVTLLLFTIRHTSLSSSTT